MSHDDRLAEHDWETIQQLRRELGRAEAKIEGLEDQVRRLKTWLAKYEMTLFVEPISSETKPCNFAG